MRGKRNSFLLLLMPQCYSRELYFRGFNTVFLKLVVVELVIYFGEDTIKEAAGDDMASLTIFSVSIG